MEVGGNHMVDVLICKVKIGATPYHGPTVITVGFHIHSAFSFVLDTSSFVLMASIAVSISYSSQHINSSGSCLDFELETQCAGSRYEEAQTPFRFTSPSRSMSQFAAQRSDVEDLNDEPIAR